MPNPALTLEEQQHIDAGPWFGKLSPTLRNAILARATVRRLADGATQLSPSHPGSGHLREKLLACSDSKELHTLVAGWQSALAA